MRSNLSLRSPSQRDIAPCCQQARRLPLLCKRCISHAKWEAQDEGWRAGQSSALAALVGALVTLHAHVSEPALATQPTSSTSTCIQEHPVMHLGQPSTPGLPLMASVTGLFGEERDPIEPFTLYGSTSKKYAIEKLDGEKIVSRKRGVTVDTCVSSIQASADSPNQPREKALAAENGKCSRAEGTSLKETCADSCKSACTTALDRWKLRTKEASGFALLDSDGKRLFRSCSRQCTYDCTREGKTYDFSVPFRP